MFVRDERLERPFFYSSSRSSNINCEIILYKRIEEWLKKINLDSDVSLYYILELEKLEEIYINFIKELNVEVDEESFEIYYIKDIKKYIELFNFIKDNLIKFEMDNINSKKIY